MVFGLFKKPADTAALWTNFNMLKSSSPAAAYLYADAFKVAFGYAQVPYIPGRQRKQYVEDYLEECIRTFSIDKGSRMLAVQAIIKIADRSPGGWEKFPTDRYVIEIAKSTDRHRQLGKKDSKRPDLTTQRGFIEHVNTKTLKEFIDYTAENLPEDIDEEERDFQLGKTIAVFDIIAEWETGYLERDLSLLDRWVKA